jgi:hypothetical protein
MTRRLDEREVPLVQGSCIAFRGERACQGGCNGKKADRENGVDTNGN